MESAINLEKLDFIHVVVGSNILDVLLVVSGYWVLICLVQRGIEEIAGFQGEGSVAMSECDHLQANSNLLKQKTITTIIKNSFTCLLC